MVLGFGINLAGTATGATESQYQAADNNVLGTNIFAVTYSVNGAITVDSGATLNVDGFTQAGLVTVSGALNITSNSDASSALINPGGTFTIQPSGGSVAVAIPAITNNGALKTPVGIANLTGLSVTTGSTGVLTVGDSTAHTSATTTMDNLTVNAGGQTNVLESSQLNITNNLVTNGALNQAQTATTHVLGNATVGAVLTGGTFIVDNTLTVQGTGTFGHGLLPTATGQLAVAPTSTLVLDPGVGNTAHINGGGMAVINNNGTIQAHTGITDWSTFRHHRADQPRIRPL